MKINSKKMRESARNEECTLRLVGVCNFNPETTVLCHVGSNSGTGNKCSDNMAVFGCSSCHSEIDSKPKHSYASDILRALGETQRIWIDKGLMVCK